VAVGDLSRFRSDWDALFVAPLLFTQIQFYLYAFTLIFMLTPIRGLLNTLPELLRANIALEKINALGLSLIAQRTEPEQPAVAIQQPDWQSLQMINSRLPGEREDSHFTLGSTSRCALEN